MSLIPRANIGAPGRRLSLTTAPAGKPREPLFNLNEIAERFGTTGNRLRALMRFYTGLEPQFRAGGTSTPQRLLYRMSDAKKWWRALPAHITGLSSTQAPSSS